MENHSYGQIIGNPDAPYLNGLAQRFALATTYDAVAHPSLPNYLALIGGETFGISSDCTTCHVDGPNLAGELSTAGIPWRAFMEGMPSACFSGGSFGRYAKKHDPFMYFDDVRTNHRICSNVVPLSRLGDSPLPDFTWITPDLCHDMHDCSIATGDAFLRRTVPGLLRDLGSDGVLFVTFDEGNGDNHVATIAAGGGVRPGRYRRAFTHHSLLRTIEEHFGVALTGAAASAPSMRTMLTQP
jgi:acid phosphatase